MRQITELFLIRHAEVEARYHEVFGGKIDMGISELGRKQAEALAHYLKGIGFDAVYASPMKRVLSTHEPFAEHMDSQPTILKGLREIDFGAWTGMKWHEVAEVFDISTFDWLHHLERDEVPEAERRHQFHSRVDECLREILNRESGRKVGVFCHGGVIRVLLSILLDMPLSKTASFEFDYASVSHVHWSPGRVEVQLLNYKPWATT